MITASPLGPSFSPPPSLHLSLSPCLFTLAPALLPLVKPGSIPPPHPHPPCCLRRLAEPRPIPGMPGRPCLDHCLGAPNGGHTHHDRDFSSSNLPVQCLVSMLLAALHSGRQGPWPGHLEARAPAMIPRSGLAIFNGAIGGQRHIHMGVSHETAWSEAYGSRQLRIQASLVAQLLGAEFRVTPPSHPLSHGLSQAARVDIILRLSDISSSGLDRLALNRSLGFRFLASCAGPAVSSGWVM